MFTLAIPSFNSSSYLDEALASVLDKKPSWLEIILVDNQSSDVTPAIIAKYANLIDVIIVEPDKGQSDAINKALKLASGSLFGWLNADDISLRSGLLRVYEAHLLNSNAIIAAKVVSFSSNLTVCNIESIISNRALTSLRICEFWSKRCVWHQPGIFVPTYIMKKLGGLDISLHYAMDHKLLIQALAEAPVTEVPYIATAFRIHPAGKGVKSPMLTLIEKASSTSRLWNSVSSTSYWLDLELYAYLFKLFFLLLLRLNPRNLILYPKLLILLFRA